MPGILGGPRPRSPDEWEALARPHGGMGGSPSANEIERMQRRAVVSAAMEWVGTPYHHLGDVKGVGVDCAMFLVRVFVDSGLVPPFDPRPYPTDWHLHRGEERYLGAVLDRAHEVEQPGPGDIVLYQFGRTLSHSALVTTWPRVIHAQVRVGCISADASKDEPLASRAPRFFSLWSN